MKDSLLYVILILVSIVMYLLISDRKNLSVSLGTHSKENIISYLKINFDILKI